VQHSGEALSAPLELRVYPGADASYLFYEDAGEGWGYQKGEHSVIPITWNDKRRELTIGATRGAYPGMVKEREFRVVLVTPENGVGLEPAAKTADLRYNGRKVSRRL
jgi:alpha-D-xyloside xylohydrolase